ncbi:MAG: PDZ domain-containing protein [Deltaproteobacteria bacterium]|nr:PDZ domain-containing protein [Deltaproteobacteria bacterium]
MAQKRLLYAVPVLAVAATLAVALTALFVGLSVRDQPFIGFFFHRSGAVAAMQRASWQGSLQGVSPGDRVVAIDGRQISDGSALRHYLSSRQRGQRVVVSLARRSASGQVYTLKMKIRQLTRRDVGAMFALPYSIGSLYLLLGAVLMFVRRDRTAALVSGICMCAAAFYTTTFVAHMGHWLARVWLIYPLLGSISLHLFSVFPARPTWARRWLVIAGYVAGGLVLTLSELTYTNARWSPVASLICGWFVALCFLLDLLLLSASARAAPTDELRNKARTIRVGLIVMIAGAVIWQLVIARVWPNLLTAEGVLTMSAMFPVLLAYAVIRRNIFDLDLVLRTTTTYVIASALVFAVYIALVFILGLAIQTWTRRYTELMENVEAVAISTIIAAVIFNPLRRNVQRVVDRLFYREKGVARAAVAAIEREMAETETVPTAAKVLVEGVRRFLRCDFALLFTPSVGNQALELAAVTGTVPESIRRAWPRSAVQQAIGSAQIVTSIAPDEHPNPSAGRDVLEAWRDHGMSLLLPLRTSGTLAGVLGVGPRQQELGYTHVERDALLTLAPTAALALRNVLLLRERADRERLATLGQLSAVIIHEIKNPLGVIKVSSGTLRKRFEPDESSYELAGFIEDEVDRMNRAIGQFLAFARPVAPTIDRHQFAPLVHKTLDPLRDELKGLGIALEIDIAASVRVDVDRDQLRQVLLNLLINAKEAMAADSQKDSPGSPPAVIRLKATQATAQTVEIALFNSGRPLSAELADRLFEPFFTTKQGGTGLGLAIARQLVVGLGGRIEARRRDDGVEFVITLRGEA